MKLITIGEEPVYLTKACELAQDYIIKNNLEPDKNLIFMKLAVDNSIESLRKYQVYIIPPQPDEELGGGSLDGFFRTLEAELNPSEYDLLKVM